MNWKKSPYRDRRVPQLMHRSATSIRSLELKVKARSNRNTAGSADLYDLQDPNSHYTPVPNEIIEGMCRANLGAHEGRILACLLRKTFGYYVEEKHLRKKYDCIALSQFDDLVKLDRRRICEALDRLEERNILTAIPSRLDRASHNTKPKTYGVNLNVSEWKLSYTARTEVRAKKRQSRKTILPSKDSAVLHGQDSLSKPSRTKLSYPDAPTKEDPKEIKENGKDKIARARASKNFLNLDSESKDSDKDKAAENQKIANKRRDMVRSGLWDVDKDSEYLNSLKTLGELIEADVARRLELSRNGACKPNDSEMGDVPRYT
jgi:phage replication O-like protein O